MRHSGTARALGWTLALATLGWSPAAGQATPAADHAAAVDAIFERVDGTRRPGCAVGVSRQGVPVLTRAYGMADLEHDVPNRPGTVFEPGSVAKQFTAAATLLLVQDGRLSLDDDIRTHIPELPDYGEPITVGHLIHHTSGLRDWGAIAAIHGWPRTTRVHTHAHMLDIASRQTSLNHRPGEYYSYTNTGYNLQAVLVERVSGMPFAEFTRKRLFEPLGMTRTEWRDDFTRVVKDRAVAYRRAPEGGYRMLMPFENVHGNGGLLTTVADLLTWTRNLETGQVGGPRFVEAMHRRGVLASGRPIDYAGGLIIDRYRGVRQVQHSGGTAAYNAHLTRFPDQGLAVAVMCNAGDANAVGLANRVADLYLGDAAAAGVPAGLSGPPVELPPDRLAALAGGYRDVLTGFYLQAIFSDGRLRFGGLPLSPVSDVRFEAPGGVLVFDPAPPAGGRPRLTMKSVTQDSARLEPVADWTPTPRDLADFAGTYRSDEAEATYRMVVEEGGLVLQDRYGSGVPLRPAYRDAFTAMGTTYLFRRDGRRRVTGLSLSAGRVWDLRFVKVAPPARGAGRPATGT
jgi:CubicO group peptidase (beta-lactamase class C family)